MKLHIEGSAGKSIDLYVDGALKAEIICGTVATDDDLKEQIGRARAAQTALAWLRGLLTEMDRAAQHANGDGASEKDRRVAWAAGFEAGLRGEARYLCPSGLPSAPEWGRKGFAAFNDGWSRGEALLRAMKIATGSPVGGNR